MTTQNQTNQTNTNMPVFEKLDLHRHAVIQASAGTGKTFTVERLVLRYLLQADEQTSAPKFTLDDILLVTYTEKATGELKERVRGFVRDAVDKLKTETTLAECAAQDYQQQLRTLELPVGDNDAVLPLPVLLMHLEKQLQNFDRAQIFTIHGFCSKVIKENAFYCNIPMQLDMSDGTETLNRVLRDHLNSGQPLSLNSITKWMKNSANLLSQIVDIRDVSIGEQNDSSVETLTAALTERLTGLTGISDEECTALLASKNIKKDGSEGALLIKAEKHKRAIKGLTELPNMTAEQNELELFKLWLDTYISSWRSIPDDIFFSATAKNNLDKLSDKREGGWVILSQDEVIRDCINVLVDIELAQKKAEVSELFQRYSEQKLAHSELTFNDMIKIVSDKIADKKNNLRTQLQRQYKVGIVDEFQDTSSRQWTIFRSMFIDNNEHHERTLMVVGDEKQSIYSFQGSEVSTCLEAIKEIVEKHQGQQEDLDTNYRSTPGLIEAYNALFRTTEWFGKFDKDQKLETPLPKTGLYNGYQDVAAGKDDDTHQDKPIWVCDVAKFDSLDDKKAALSAWTVAAISHLIDHCGIPPSDIAILVERKAEADDIITELRKRGKPVTRSKEAGLFKSRYTLNVIAALDAINDHKNPGKIKTLALTSFFGAAQSPLPLAQSISAQQQQAETLLAQWHSYKEKQNWSALLRSLFEDSDLFTQLSSTDKRAVMAYRQLRSYALKRLINEGDDLSTLTKRLRSLNKGTISEGDEENIFHKETSSEAIQMLTLHSSKGLEFPYVFIPSGSAEIKSRAADDGFIRTFDQQGMKLALNTNDNAVKNNEKAFTLQEKRRLWYVGVTRAETLLALPNWGKVRGSCAYKDFLDTSINAKESQQYIRRFDVPDDYEEHTLVAALQESNLPQRANSQINSAVLNPTLTLSSYAHPVRQRVWINESASSLMTHNNLRAGHKSADEGSDTAQTQVESQAFTFPKGARTGNMLHDMLEKIHFTQDSTIHEIDLVKKYFPRLSDEEQRNYATRSRALLESVKTLPIHSVEGEAPFTLNEININASVAEPQFHFSIDHRGYLFPQNQADIGGWVQGFIDLMFEHNGKYYILDWKSNSLSGYTEKHLDQAMEDHQYTLQAALYVKALRAFLQLRYPNDNIESKVGGAIYVFLRARENQDDNSGESGIWFATEQQLERIMPTTQIHQKFITKLEKHNADVEVTQ